MHAVEHPSDVTNVPDPFPAGLRPIIRWFTTRRYAMQLFIVFGLTCALEYPLWFHAALTWYPPGGARVMLLVILPVRLWPAIVAAELFWRIGIELSVGRSTLHILWSCFPQPLGSALAIGWLKRRWTPRDVEMPAGMLRLLVALLFSGLANTLSNTIFVVYIYPVVAESNLLNFAFTAIVGATDVPLVFTSAALALLLMPGGFRFRRQHLIDCVLALLYVSFVGILARQGTSDGGLRSDYASILIPLPILYLSFRYGWRGAALALSVLAPVLLYGNVRYVGAPGDIAQNLLLLTLTGAAGLLMGSAIDALRRSREDLGQRNVDLDAMNRELGELSVQLRQAARRNLELEEAQMKRIAGELHDELGQNLTAIQTRIKLIDERLRGAGLDDQTRAMQDIISTMRHSVRGMMNSLRPAALDQFGLTRALKEGPIAELMDGAGIAYDVQFRDSHERLDGLDGELANTVYRIVQEAATNTVRHARATGLRIRLQCRRHRGGDYLFIDIRDDGIGLPRHPDPTRRGLQGMHDRVTAHGGTLNISNTQPGTRIHALLPVATLAVSAS